MNFLVDFFPIILFFVAFRLGDVYVATAVAIVATVAQVTYVYLRHKKVPTMHLVTLGLVVVLGGATLLLKDQRFIQWKPTLVNWAFALVFLGSHVVGSKPIIRRMMEQHLVLPEPVWLRLSLAWVVFFAFAGGANLFVAFNYPLSTWVNFKVFGLLGITVAFVILQGTFLSRYAQENSDPDALKDS